VLGYLVLACRATVFGIFLFSVATKVRGRTAYREFVASVAALNVVPPRWVAPAARGTVLGESAVVLLLAWSRTAPVGFLLGAGLLAAFTAVIVAVMGQGRRQPCRCFGASTTPLGLPHVVRNAVLLVACATCAVGQWAVGSPGWHPGGLAVALTAAAVAVLFVVRLDDVVALLGDISDED
jgi:hypothetical protein